jgi:hypothetical protein
MIRKLEMPVYRDPAYRRYLKRFIPIILFYVAGIFLASTAIPEKAEPNLSTIGIALIPGLAIVGIVWAMGRLVVELDDEYLRMLEIRKSLVATAVVLATTGTIGLLELYTTMPKTRMFFVFPLWCAGLGIGGLVNKVRGI